MPVLLALLLLLAAEPRKAADLAASGWKAFEEGRLAEAERKLEEATRLAPASASIALALGQVYLSAGKPRLAIPALEKAVRALANAPDVRFALAQAYQAVDQDIKALAVLAGRPPDGELTDPWRFTRGFSLFRLGRYQEAEAVFRALLSSDQMRAPARFFLANCLYGRGHYEESLQYYAQAIDAGDRPDNKALNAYFYNQGLALYQLSRFEEALVSFRRSIDRYPKDALQWFFLGRCQTELGRYAEAIESLEESVRREPDFRLAYYQLARLHTQHGNPQRGQELFQKVAGLRRQELEQEEQMARRLKVSSPSR